MKNSEKKRSATRKSSVLSSNDAPPANLFEVNTFGPGRGESSALHLGDGNWIIVDSCRDQRSGSPAPLAYLRSIGIDPATAVQLVVATHAHDDHLAGIAETYEACKSAFFVCSSALSREDFAAILRIDAESTRDLKTRNFSELVRVFDELRNRKSKGLLQGKFATEGRVLWSAALSSGQASIQSLSPSDQAVFNTVRQYQNYFPAPGDSLRPPRIDPNELSIALWVQVGQHAVLLGADLLAGPEGCGWGAVIESFSPPIVASLYKVAHHGSRTSHHEQVWQTLLSPQPVSVLAPYRARHVVPSEVEIDYLRQRSEAVYSCAAPRVPAPSRGVTRAAVKLNQLAWNVRDPWGEVGHVRSRMRENGTWDVVLFKPALQIA